MRRSTTFWARLLGVVKAFVEGASSTGARARVRRGAGVASEGGQAGCWRCGVDLATVRALLEADSPRVRCKEHGVVAAGVVGSTRRGSYVRI